jgi:HAD superfamily hydrolase (TIGR01509 family)
VIATRPAAVLFDMDGLLLDTERTTRASMISVMLAMGYPMTEAIYAELIGLPVDAERAHLADLFGNGFDYDEMRRQRRAVDEARHGLSPPLRPGARAIVAAVARLGIPRAIATSSRRDKTLAYLANTGLLAMFDAVLTRDDVARGKPHPDLYLAAAAALGQAPGTCLALEDSHNGVRAAHAAGVPVIMVPDLLPPTDEMQGLAAAIVPGLDRVSDWLAAL